ncbi:MAG: RusA family crossover junction endodeoxyribonuclease [Gemmatimonadales bacterium]|nr:RusA family crossover junction endodeoxyribonuclease [Gemmatimonadales bacterium]
MADLFVAPFDLSRLPEIAPEFVGKNPVPYTRATQRQKWTESFKKYPRWCNALRACFGAAVPASVSVRNAEGEDIAAVAYLGPLVHPILLRKEHKRALICSVRTEIVWKDESHADADNVHKAVLDALFANDKLVNRHRVTSDYGDEAQMTVTIEIRPRGPQD